MVSITGIISSVSAQDSVRTKTGATDGDGFRKYELATGIFWRNLLSDDLGKFGAGLNYTLSDGTSSNIYTIGLAAHFTYNITRNTGLVSGLEIAAYSGKASGNFSGAYDTYDRGAYSFNFSYSLKDYSEQQKLTLLSIPLMVKYTTNPFSDIHARYFCGFGFKIGLPLVRKATIKPGLVTTTGYFYEERELYGGDTPFPEEGFVTNYSAPKQQSKIGFKPLVAIALETGFIFTSNEQVSAGASIYCDFGLNNILKHDSRQMVEYQKLDTKNLLFNSIMTTNKVNKVEMFSIGLKLIVNFNLDKKVK
jgi:hypothetical protein